MWSKGTRVEGKITYECGWRGFKVTRVLTDHVHGERSNGKPRDIIKSRYIKMWELIVVKV